MTLPEWLYLLLITTGATVIGVLWLMRRQWQGFVSVQQVLWQVNEAQGRDLLAFLACLPEHLARVGVEGVSYRLEWFGHVHEDHMGSTHGSPIERTWMLEDARLQLVLHVAQYRGERAMFMETLANQVAAMAYLDMILQLVRMQSVAQGVSRYQMFLAHDLKNLAQMVALFHRQIQQTQPQQAAQSLSSWQQIAPMMAERAELLAQKLVSAARLSEGGGMGESEQVPVSGRQVVARLQRWAQVHGLSLQVSGLDDALMPMCLALDWSAFDDAAFQLMRNFQQYTDAKKSVHLAWRARAEGDWWLDFCHEDMVSAGQVARMRQPLWTSSAQGMGLGLWQMAQALGRLGGESRFDHLPDGRLRFSWRLRACQSE